MNCRERVLAAVSLEEPDRIPLDSSFTEEFSYKLTKRLGPTGQTDLRVRLGLDVMYCGVNDGFFAPACKGGEEVRFSDGSYLTELGVRVKTMKAGGVRFLEHPIKTYEDLRKISLSDLSEEHRYRSIRETIKMFGSEYAVFGEAGWGIFEKSWILRGFADFLADIYRTPALVESLLDLIMNSQIEATKRMCEYPIDVIFYGDDFGMQDRTIMAPNIWRKFLKPRWAKVFGVPKRKRIPVMFHSDGNVLEIIPDLIEIGVDILDPVQPKALDPQRVKDSFGEKLALHGLIDIQEVLPFYSSTGVYEAVKKLIEQIASGGGVILSPTHTVLPEVRLDNYLSFLKSVKKWGRYKP